MSSATKSHRAIAVGLSGGLGLALPLAAYAATLGLDTVNDAVRADALPFAAGALVGVGLLAVSTSILERTGARGDASVWEDASAGAAREAAPAAHRGRGASSAMPEGVPVISRAADALDEEQAWAEIDAMFSDDSPISCDPARSKDVYEIAFEELRRAGRARTAAGEAARTAATPATADAAAATAGIPAFATSAFMAAAPAGAARAAQASVGGSASVSATARAAAAPIPPAQAPASAADEDAGARDAAIAALYGASASAAPGAQVPAVPVISQVPYPEATFETQDGEVPMADYRGHEDMWASALAILAEDAPAAPETPAASSPAETAYVEQGHMAAVAEGGISTQRHSHVNELLEEEFDRVDSQSMRKTSRDFLRVIQGGTASMPRLQAEA